MDNEMSSDLHMYILAHSACMCTGTTHNDKNMSWVSIGEDTFLSYWEPYAEDNVGPKHSVKSLDR